MVENKIVFENNHKYKITFDEHPFMEKLERGVEYTVVANVDKDKINFLKKNKISFSHKMSNVLYFGKVRVLKDYGNIKDQKEV